VALAPVCAAVIWWTQRRMRSGRASEA
jgi:hypothetical protein